MSHPFKPLVYSAWLDGSGTRGEEHKERRMGKERKGFWERMRKSGEERKRNEEKLK